MAPDKYSAVWVSHTSICDFLQCQRAYYLRNVYKDPKSGHKIKLMSPPLALGQVIHEVIDALSVLPTEDRFKTLLMDRFETAWKKVTGKRGGFLGADVEDRYKRRGREMIARITNNPGPIAEKAVKIKEELPYYWLSEEENIILCGKIDWLQYIPETDSVHIIDFKTGNGNEDDGSLQLPIYYLLVKNTQKRQVSKVSYWYLGRLDHLTDKELPDEQASYERVMEIAQQMKTARQLQRFVCEQEGCQYCNPMEALIRGEGEFVYVDDYGADVYILHPTRDSDEEESIIL